MISAELIKKSFLRGLIANNIQEGIALPGYFLCTTYFLQEIVYKIYTFIDIYKHRD